MADDERGLYWYTVYAEDGTCLGEVLAYSDDNAIELYLDDHPDTPNPDYIEAILAND